MMKRTEQHLDKLSKKIVKQQEYRLPQDFTDQVMQKIDAIPEATAYKPLITKRGWLGIIALTVLGIYISLSADAGGALWIEKFGWSRPELNLAETFGQLQFSNIMVYSVVLFSVFVFIQMALVKKQQAQQLQF